jgi:hypothetical protein
MLIITIATLNSPWPLLFRTHPSLLSHVKYAFDRRMVVLCLPNCSLANFWAPKLHHAAPTLRIRRYAGKSCQVAESGKAVRYRSHSVRLKLKWKSCRGGMRCCSDSKFHVLAQSSDENINRALQESSAVSDRSLSSRQHFVFKLST